MIEWEDGLNVDYDIDEFVKEFVMIVKELG